LLPFAGDIGKRVAVNTAGAKFHLAAVDAIFIHAGVIPEFDRKPSLGFHIALPLGPVLNIVDLDIGEAAE
jgi:hypothetical protein